MASAQCRVLPGEAPIATCPALLPCLFLTTSFPLNYIDRVTPSGLYFVFALRCSKHIAKFLFCFCLFGLVEVYCRAGAAVETLESLEWFIAYGKFA